MLSFVCERILVRCWQNCILSVLSFSVTGNRDVKAVGGVVSVMLIVGPSDWQRSLLGSVVAAAAVIGSRMSRLQCFSPCLRLPLMARRLPGLPVRFREMKIRGGTLR